MRQRHSDQSGQAPLVQTNQGHSSLFSRDKCPPFARYFHIFLSKFPVTRECGKRRYFFHALHLPFYNHISLFVCSPIVVVSSGVDVSFIIIKILPLISAIKQSKTTNVTILNPVVHLLGDDAASIGYIKVTQTLDK